MKRLLVFAVALVGIATLTQASYSQYTVQTLPTLGGASLAQRINDRGQIVGERFLFEGPPHAALWYKGTVTDLGTLGGDTSIANDINNRGQITGYSQTATGAIRSFLWQDGVMTNIGTFGAAATF